MILINQKFKRLKSDTGFTIIMILITVAIMAILAWGAFSYSNGQKKNQIQAGQDAIKAAQDAADKENQYNQSLQGDLQNQGAPGVDYGSVRKSLENLK